MRWTGLDDTRLRPGLEARYLAVTWSSDVVLNLGLTLPPVMQSTVHSRAFPAVAGPKTWRLKRRGKRCNIFPVWIHLSRNLFRTSSYDTGCIWTYSLGLSVLNFQLWDGSAIWGLWYDMNMIWYDIRYIMTNDLFGITANGWIGTTI